MSNIRDMILGADDLKFETVEVPEWGCVGPTALRVKTLTGVERLAWSENAFGKDGKSLPNFRERLIIATVIDADGNFVFQPTDIEALAAKSSIPTMRLYAVAEKLNLLSVDSVDAAVGNS